MKLARSRRRAACAFASLAAAYAAPALAYDDKSTVSSVMDLVGVSSEVEASKIDYSERPKLVLPPSRGGALPSPRESADRPAGWPSDASAARGGGDRFARVPNAGAEAKEPGFLERALSSGAKSNAPVADEPSRRMLTEPPSGYRRPTQDLSKIRDKDSKSGSWWNPLTYFGGGDSGEGRSNPAATDMRGSGAHTAATDTRGGSESVLSRLRMPSFFRGSSDND